MRRLDHKTGAGTVVPKDAERAAALKVGGADLAEVAHPVHPQHRHDLVIAELTAVADCGVYDAVPHQ
jgi:hypothetical protein